jgi:hypothetical protein
MTVAWIVPLTLVLLMVALIAAKHRIPPPPAGALDEFRDEEIIRAAVELHAIDQRLNMAWTRHELRSDANRLRRELAEEMRLIEALGAAKRLEK